MMVKSRAFNRSLLLMVAWALSSCVVLPSKPDNKPDKRQASTSFAIGHISKHYYDGKTDDLATGGMGLRAIRNGVAPLVAEPLSPSIAELRRLAIYRNIRSLSAMSEAAGYGSLYAEFNFDAEPVSGYEIIAPLLYEDGQVASVMMLQVPDSFDWDRPCLISAAASASRGIYGALGIVGLWALDKGCAVVHSDKGTGTGFHWLDDGVAVNVDGRVQKPNDNTHFFLTGNEGYIQQFPHRIATKHAHSQKNVSKGWAGAVLSSIEHAFDLLNSEFDKKKVLAPENTLVIGAGISNGGGAITVAAEQDTANFFDGIVLTAPNISVPAGYVYHQEVGGKTYSYEVKPLMNVANTQALYLPCAALYSGQGDFSGQAAMPSALDSHWQGLLETRCQKLKAAGLLIGESFAEQSAESLDALKASGYPLSANSMALTFARNLRWNSLMLSFTSDLGAFGLSEHLCQYSYAYVNSDGEPIATPDEVKALVFGRTSGSLPALGMQLMNDASANGPRDLMHSVDSDGVLDLGFDNTLCIQKHLASERLQKGQKATQASGNLHGLPAIIVHGEADNIIQVKNTSRAYAALNSEIEQNSSLVYYEIKNAQHIDRLVDYPPYRMHYIPLQFYFERSLDIMYQHLREGTAIPASREIATVPASSALAKLTPDNLPSITSSKSSPIKIKRGVLVYTN